MDEIVKIGTFVFPCRLASRVKEDEFNFNENIDNRSKNDFFSEKKIDFH